jgi:uncharacterized membrane protein YjjB (DUF3815 family)
MANNLISGIISIALGVIVLANVYMPIVKGVNSTTWSTSEVAKEKDTFLSSKVMGCFGSMWNHRYCLRNNVSLWTCISEG